MHLDPIKLKKDTRKFMKNFFTSEYLKPYKDNTEEFLKKNPKFQLRFFSQVKFDFDSKLEKIIKDFDIEPKNKTVLIFGGFTGDYAYGLKKIGFDVIFTDPLKEHVEHAISLGLESYQYTFEEIPGEYFKRADIVSTFECYYPFEGYQDPIFDYLRAMVPPEGLLFAESKQTRTTINRKNEYAFENAFSALTQFYNLTIRRSESEDLRIYQVKQNYDTEKSNKIMKDIILIKTLDSFPEEDKESYDWETKLKNKSGLKDSEFKESLEHIRCLYSRSEKFEFIYDM